LCLSNPAVRLNPMFLTIDGAGFAGGQVAVVAVGQVEKCTKARRSEFSLISEFAVALLLSHGNTIDFSGEME